MDWSWMPIDRLAAQLKKGQINQETDQELAFHLEMETQENLRRGMNPEEARRAARIRLGGLDQSQAGLSRGPGSFPGSVLSGKIFATLSELLPGIPDSPRSW